MERVNQWCETCRQSDTHPRHLVLNPNGVVARHMDCCRDAGCPDNSCDNILAEAGAVRGEDLVTFLQERNK